MSFRILLVSLLVLLTGCGSVTGIFSKRPPEAGPTESIRPPQPELSVGSERVPFALGSYCWREGATGICADSIAPPDLLKFRQIPVMAVGPGAQMTVHFPALPKEMSAAVHGGGGPLAVDGSKVTLPTAAGTHIIILFARWDRGDGSYVFHVDVK